ncbi:MAG: hypothetical protein AB8B91_09530, partial [Rubripirellula sp.]
MPIESAPMMGHVEMAAPMEHIEMAPSHDSGVYSEGAVVEQPMMMDSAPIETAPIEHPFDSGITHSAPAETVIESSSDTPVVPTEVPSTEEPAQPAAADAPAEAPADAPAEAAADAPAEAAADAPAEAPADAPA